jgi:hypothetical protein
MSEETYPDVIELKLKLRFPTLINSTSYAS